MTARLIDRTVQTVHVVNSSAVVTAYTTTSIPSSSAWLIVARFVGYSSTIAAVDKAGAAESWCLVANNAGTLAFYTGQVTGGTVSANGVIRTHVEGPDLTWGNFEFAISGTTVQVNLHPGSATNTLDYMVYIEIQEWTP